MIQESTCQEVGAFIFDEFERRKTTEYQGRWYRKVTLRGNDYVYANFGTRGVIRLLNDSNLETALWRYGARKVANECKYVYSTIHHQSINITTASLKWEIFGHYAPSVIASVEQYAPSAIVRIISNLVLRQTDVIDMGEKHLDSNRKWWDILSMNANSDELIKYIEEKYRVIVLE